MANIKGAPILSTGIVEAEYIEVLSEPLHFTYLITLFAYINNLNKILNYVIVTRSNLPKTFWRSEFSYQTELGRVAWANYSEKYINYISKYIVIYYTYLHEL